MGDIVATIQAEQDRVIRAESRGVLVVQGGPGTGKTVVALHRAAYLLYTHRQRLERSGVLLVGPSAVFLRYIEQVLPSLGETGVVMSTPGDLYPGVVATAEDPPAVAAVKGDARMARVVANAVTSRQRVPEADQVLDVDGVAVTLRPGDVAAARTRARRSRKPHNAARVVFVLDLLDRLAVDYARAIGRLGEADLDNDDRADLVGILRESRDVRIAVNLAWLPVTPERLADPRRLEQAAPHLTRAERDLLRRDRDAPWTVGDVPLLDEAAELLGEDDESARAAARRAAQERAGELRYAWEVLEATGSWAHVAAEQLVDRFADSGPALSTAERAAGDRSWAYGHVVVDEAQELSAMQWRVLVRRCPTRSMTLVGDVAQTGSAAGASSWGAALAPYIQDRFTQAELTVNYRTPAQVMELAVRVARAGGVEVATPTSVRDTGGAPGSGARRAHEGARRGPRQGRRGRPRRGGRRAHRPGGKGAGVRRGGRRRARRHRGRAPSRVQRPLRRDDATDATARGRPRGAGAAGGLRARLLAVGDERVRLDRHDDAFMRVGDPVVLAVAVLQALVERGLRVVVVDRLHGAAHLEEAVAVARVGDEEGDPRLVLDVAELLPRLRVRQADPLAVPHVPHGVGLRAAVGSHGREGGEQRLVEQVAVAVGERGGHGHRISVRTAGPCPGCGTAVAARAGGRHDLLP
jgi:hypothetical protein